MKITFLGTSAGEEYPCVWCECENCEKARRWGGKNIRRNSSVILDGDVMIDIGKTAHMQAERFGVNMRKVETLLVTHSHKDHFNTHTLWTRIAVFTQLPQLNVFGSKQVENALLSNDRYEEISWNMRFNTVEPFKKYYADGLDFFTLDGNHKDGEMRSINYVITRKNRTFLYLTDTGCPFDETLEALKKYNYDFIITEGTSGFGEASRSHMGFEKNLRLLEFFNENKLWKDKPDYYLTHMSPHWCPPHDEYSPIAAEKGMTLAYDGLVLEYPYI